MIEFGNNLSLSSYYPQWSKPRICLVVGLVGVISALAVAVLLRGKKECSANPLIIPPTPAMVPADEISSVSIPILSSPESEPLPTYSQCELLSKSWEAERLQTVQDRLDLIPVTYTPGCLKFYVGYLIKLGQCLSQLELIECRFEENKVIHSKLKQQIGELQQKLPSLYSQFERKYSTIENDYWLLVGITKTAEKMCDLKNHLTTDDERAGASTKYNELSRQMGEIRARYPNLNLPIAVPEDCPVSVEPKLEAVYVNCLKKLDNLSHILNHA